MSERTAEHRLAEHAPASKRGKRGGNWSASGGAAPWRRATRGGDMNHLLAAKETVLAHLSPASREQFRRVRQAEADAFVAAHRLEVVRLLASIGAYQLGLAELSTQHAVAAQPELAECGREVMNCVAAAIRVEIESFVERGSEAAR
jgi:hypothetical protein